MPRNVYSEIHLHIIWHTKSNCAIIEGHVERHLHQYLRQRIAETPGVNLCEINGTNDHVHIAVTVPPTLHISEWIGELKGASAYFINHQITNRKLLEWQTGYGVVSFGSKDLLWVIDYIHNQKEHHSRGTVHDRLEQIERPAECTNADKPVETGS